MNNECELMDGVKI